MKAILPRTKTEIKVRSFKTAAATFLALSILIAPLAPYSNVALASKTVRYEQLEPGDIVGVGLDQRTSKLMNSGKWKEVISRLESLTSSETTPSRNLTWLAFAYLFENKCDALKALGNRINAYSVSAKGDQVTYPDCYRLIVQAFSQACEGKADDADKTLQAVPGKYANDALVNFALAAVAGKQGHPAAAVALLQRAVELAPNFAWGYRCIAFLEFNWIKDRDKGEKYAAKALSLEPNLIEVRTALIDSRLAHNDFDGAIALADASLKLSHKDATAHFLLAQIYIEQWRLNEALAELKDAIRLDSENPKYYRNRASIKRYQGKLDEAIVDQEKAVDLSKDKSFEYVELASLNLEAGNKNRAADNLHEALKLDPGNSAAHDRLVKLLLEEKRYEDLRDEFRRYIAAHPDDAAGHLGLATALVNLGSTKEAIEEFKASANLDNKNPEPHKQLGALYIKQKNYSDAAKEYTRALNINPSSVPDLVALGYAYAQSEDYLQAEAALVTALALQQLTQPTSPPAGPSHYDIMRSLATLLFEEGRYAEAATHFETIVASEGSEPVTSDQFLLAEAQVLRDRSHFDALLQAFDKLSDEQKDSERMALIDTLLKNRQADLVIPILGKFIVERATPEDSARFYIEKAKASRLKSDLVKAEELDNAAIGLKDRIKEATPGVLSDAYLEMAEIAMEKNDLNVAQANAENAIETDPKSFTAYTSLGKVYLKKQNNKQALDSAKRALELNPYSARAYLLAGDALFNSGDVKEAITNYRKAIEIYPNLLEAHESLLVALKKLSNKEDVQKEADEVARLRAVQ